MSILKKLAGFEDVNKNDKPKIEKVKKPISTSDVKESIKFQDTQKFKSTPIKKNKENLQNSMDLNKLSRNIILASILLIAVSIGYYYLIFLPQKESNRIDAENQKRTESIKNDCIDRVLKEMKSEHPKLETYEVTNFRMFNDRGCFIEAGCMSGIQDNNFKSKFNKCNNEYYNICLRGIKEQVEEMIEAEKSKKINECIKLYSN